MPDQQPQPNGSIDDIVFQAEQQLEKRLQEVRQGLASNAESIRRSVAEAPRTPGEYGYGAENTTYASDAPSFDTDTPPAVSPAHEAPTSTHADWEDAVMRPISNVSAPTQPETIQHTAQTMVPPSPAPVAPVQVAPAPVSTSAVSPPANDTPTTTAVPQLDSEALIAQLQETVREALQQEDSSALTQEIAQLTGVVQQQEEQLAATMQVMQQQRDLISEEHQHLAASIKSSFQDEFAETRKNVQDLVNLEIPSTLGELAQSSRETLDRLLSVTNDFERDRLQRVEDLELLVDAMTSGWQGIYSAITTMFERVQDFDSRMSSVEQQVTALNSLDGTVTAALDNVQNRMDAAISTMHQHLQELQPTPVVVSVSHPDVRVEQQHSDDLTMP